MSNQGKSNIYHFVLIHIGNDLPVYINSCIRQIRLFNSPDFNTIWVLAKETELAKMVDCGNLKKIPLESIHPSSLHIYFSEHYTNDSLNNFWKYTIERFFYLEEIMKLYNLQNVFHLENDIMLYVDLKYLLPVFLENYKGLAVTLDCDYRCIPGFVFVRDVHPLELFNQYVVGMLRHNRNDMQLLADFMSSIQNDEVIQTLPILFHEYDKPLRNLVGYSSLRPNIYVNHFEKFQGIFDAAAIGQYLGGISRRNNPQGRNTIGFINETCVFQCNFLTFGWGINGKTLKVPFVRYSSASNWHPIFTLHIHSKNLTQFLSDRYLPQDYEPGSIEPPG